MTEYALVCGVEGGVCAVHRLEPALVRAHAWRKGRGRSASREKERERAFVQGTGARLAHAQVLLRYGYRAITCSGHVVALVVLQAT